MKRPVLGLALLCLLLAVSAGGCTARAVTIQTESAAEMPSPSEPPPTAAASPTTEATPAPTPSPTPTPCPHPVWRDGVCTECGVACIHPGWEDGRCTVCGVACPHPGHDSRTRQCTQCGELVPHVYADSVCVLCGEGPVFETETLPRELFEPCEHRGRVETLTYTMEAVPIGKTTKQVYEKKLRVYLPYGYDPAEKYDVLILLHGILCTEDYWLVDEQEYLPESKDAVYTADLLDNLIDMGWCRKVIVATPTFYRDSSRFDEYYRRADEPLFLRELREEILPLLVENYSTWAESGSSRDISEQRQHFAFAGLSMGSIYAYTGTLTDCLDLFGWYGCFSGSDGNVNQISAALNAEVNAGFPIYYFYNSIGTYDPYFNLHRGQYRELVRLTDGLTDGKNAAFTEVKDAGHKYNAWSTGLYNFLGLAFSLPGE